MELKSVCLFKWDHLKCVILSIVIAISYVSGLTENLNPCPTGWYYSNLRCYKLFLYKGNRFYDRSWGIAEQICKANDAYLVTYNSPLEAYAIQKYLDRSGIEPSNLYWIGLRVSGGVERWVDDGDTTKYTHWHSGLPPEWLTIEADDGVAVADAKGNWYKVPNNWVVRIDGCDEPSGFVCEQRADIADIFHKHYAHQHLLHNQIQLHGDDKEEHQLFFDLENSIHDLGNQRHTDKPLFHFNAKSTVPSVNHHGADRIVANGIEAGNTIVDESNDIQSGSIIIHQSSTEERASTSPESLEASTEALTTTADVTTEATTETTTALYDMTGGQGNTEDIGESRADTSNSNSTEATTEVASSTTELLYDDITAGFETRQGFFDADSSIESTSTDSIEEDTTTETTQPVTTTSDTDPATERMISNSAPYQRSMGPDYKYTYDPGYHFINVTVYCATHGAGIHAHPLHCWQFLICGAMYGGQKEGYCYPGRRFREEYNGCVPDKTCIYGSRFVGREQGYNQD